MRMVRMVCLWGVFATQVVGQVVVPGVPISQIPAQPVTDQFGSAQPPPAGMILDDVRGEIVNFETLMAKPIMTTSDGQFVLVANDADGRLVVLDAALGLVAEVPLGQGLSAIAERPALEGEIPGEIWVTLRHQMGIAVIQMSDWSVTHLLRAPINATIAGARHADSPGGIVFNATGTRAYVPSFNTDRLVVFDAVNKAWVKNIVLQFDHHGSLVAMNEPFTVARIGDQIYIASYRSGNGTLAENDGSLAIPQPRNQTKKLEGDPNDPRRLPEFDICVVSTQTEQVVTMIRKVGTVLNGIGVSGDRLVVPNLEARNGEFIGEASFEDGRVTFNRLSFVDPVTPLGPHQHVITEDLVAGANPWVNVVLPHDVAVDAQGRVYTAGYGSGNIGAFSGTGAFLGVLPAESGPIGVAFAAATQRLYCYNRAAASVTSYDVSSALPAAVLARRDLVDPTYDNVREGRIVFLDPSNSGKGTTSCASCHQHLRNDGLSWDLSKYHDTPGPYTVAPAAPPPGPIGPPQDWQDRKGVMQTQSLLSLEEVPPFHWRGEQKDLEDFNGAFVGLLHGTMLRPEEFADMKAFVFSGHYRPNPFQMMNRDFSPISRTGATAFMNDDAVGDLSCSDCHELPTGTDCDITDRFIGLAAGRATKTAQLRGFWDKTSSLCDVDPGPGTEVQPMTGSGFLHNGTINDSDHFMDTFFGAHQHHVEISAFLKEYDSGVAPAANYSEFLDAGNPNAGAFLHAQGVAGNCGVAVQGVYFRNGQWQQLGWYLDTTQNPPKFVPSRTGLPMLTLAQLQGTVASAQARWLMLGVPPGSEKRLGVDRDRDGAFDHDEIAAGLDPTNPDTDGDGRWDGEPVSAIAPNVQSLSVDWMTTNSVKITYQTDALSPTRIEWGKAGLGFTESAGDPFPLPTGSGSRSNLWKRHHTVSIRLTEENTAYDFRVVTQGQNGIQANHPVQTTATLADDVGPSIVIQDVVLTSSTVGGTTQWNATVTISTDHGAPFQGANVRAVFTTFTAGIATAQQVVTTPGVTNPQGQVTLTLTVPAQGPGDGMAVDLPMGILDPVTGNGTGSSYNAPGFAPKWSESPKRGEKVIL
jgi:DNA-binding beta-propeller fold protein YncE